MEIFIFCSREYSFEKEIALPSKTSEQEPTQYSITSFIKKNITITIMVLYGMVYETWNGGVWYGVVWYNVKWC